MTDDDGLVTNLGAVRQRQAGAWVFEYTGYAQILMVSP